MRNLVKLAIVAGIALTGSVAAEARGKSGFKKHPDAYRYVRAESQYDITKSVVAPVRHARLGDQVLVPERGWTYCEYTCVYTLQKEYLDFWEAQDGGVSPGMLGDILRRIRRD